jgi:hypothetical protein
MAHVDSNLSGMRENKGEASFLSRVKEEDFEGVAGGILEKSSGWWPDGTEADARSWKRRW